MYNRKKSQGARSGVYGVFSDICVVAVTQTFTECSPSYCLNQNYKTVFSVKSLTLKDKFTMQNPANIEEIKQQTALCQKL